MIVIAGLIVGITVGIVQAKRRGGNGMDMAQYAAAYGIGFCLLGVLATLLLTRAL